MDPFLAGYLWAIFLMAVMAFFVHLRYRLVRRTPKHKK